MAAIVLAMFYGLVMVVAFKRDTLGQPIAEGSMLTVGMVAELLIFFWVLTAVYVKRANAEFDAFEDQYVCAQTGFGASGASSH